MSTSQGLDLLHNFFASPYASCRLEGSQNCDLQLEHGCRTSTTSSPSPNWWKVDLQTDNREFEKLDEDPVFCVEFPACSSSPPDLTSSSPCSSRSTEPEEASQTRNATAFTGANTPDGFIKELHQLLLLAQQEHELVDRTDYSFYSDTQTPEYSFVSNPQSQDMATKSSTSETSSSHSSAWAPNKPLLEHTAQRHGARKSQLGQTHAFDLSFRSLSRSTVSPINFENRPSHCPSPASTHNNSVVNYRVIKRAQSHLVQEFFEKQAEPPYKRSKNGREPSDRAVDHVYARRTASLRRADSLQSYDDKYQQRTVTDWVPTAPATPIPRRKDKTRDPIFSPVPVIAPPIEHISKFPMSPDATAKLRLIRLLEREASGRYIDGLPLGTYSRPPPYMLPGAGGVNPFDEVGGSSVEDDIKFEWEVVMGLGSNRRRSIVDWLLQVLPVRPLSPSPPSSLLSSRSSTSTSSTNSIYLEPEHNLFDQLQNSPETRFHAVWMFLRFFYLTMPHDTNIQSTDEKMGFQKMTNSHTSKTLHQEGLGLISWDVAVACLSLSVKFHRDFLNPLLPVYSQEYIALAPHSLTHEDLESAHRDILSCFDYRLGITPQAIMDQLWLALPSLRTLLGFDGGWQKTTRTAWSILLDSLREPDVQRFPVSVLTAVSLMGGMTESLTYHYRQQSLSGGEISEEESPKSPNPDSFDIRAVWDKCENEAQRDTEGVFCDIQALIGLQVRDCRLWLSLID